MRATMPRSLLPSLSLHRASTTWSAANHGGDLNFMTASSARERLLNLIAERSFRLGNFTLSSGLKSDYYIDCRTTTLHAEGSELTGRVFFDLFREQKWNPQAVGGLTMGAD